MGHAGKFMAAAFTLVACGGEAGGPSTSEAAFARWEAGAPDVRIGSIEGETVLGRVLGVAIGPDQGVYVLDGQEAAVRVFDETGRPLRTVGRKGGGPGEFATPRRMGFLGDTLWVWDAGQSRVTLFEADGRPLTTLPVPRAEGLRAGEGQRFGVLASGGRAVIGTGPLSPLLASTDRLPLMVMDRDGGSATDTIAALDQDHATAVFITLAGGGTWRPSGETPGLPPQDQIASIEVAAQAFSDASIWDLAPSGEAVVLVDRNAAEAAADHAFGLTRVRLSGDTVFSVRKPYTPIPIPAVITDSIVARYTRSFNEAVVRDVIFLPPFYPPVDAVVVARDGRTWLGREAAVGATVQRWEVFDEDGQPLAALDLPAGLTVHDAADDTVWGVVTDELDVPYVVRIPIRPAP